MGDTVGKLVVIKCGSCGRLFVPPRYMCPECGSTEFTKVTLSGQGEILTHTTIRVPPLGFEDQVPYDIAVIRLAEGINLTARIATQEGQTPKIGGKVSFAGNKEGANWFRLAN
jgi:uncharacterized OB-fold protein